MYCLLVFLCSYHLVCALGAGLQEGEVVERVHQPKSWHQVSHLDPLCMIVTVKYTAKRYGKYV